MSDTDICHVVKLYKMTIWFRGFFPHHQITRKLKIMIGCHPFSATFEVVSKEKATAGHLQRVHCQDLGAEVHLKAWGHTETLHTFPDCRLFSCTDAQTLPESSGFTNKVWFDLH